MNEGLWTLLGTGVGGLCTLATTVLNARLRRAKPDPVAAARRRLLFNLLSDRWEWRGLDLLSHVIGADKETTKGLLLEIGAKASEDGQELWGLTSRIGGADKSIVPNPKRGVLPGPPPGSTLPP